MSEQVNLLGISLKPKKPVIPISSSNFDTFDELEKRIAAEYGRRHIGYPCDDAQDLPIDDRQEHIFNSDGSWRCVVCKELMEKLERGIIN
jgi:hypothetical protein